MPSAPVLTHRGGANKTAINALLCGDPGGGKTYGTCIHSFVEELVRRGRMSDTVIDGEVVEPLRELPAGSHTQLPPSRTQDPQPPLDRPEYRKAAADVPAPIRMTTYVAMEHLLESNPVAFIELVYLARDPQHELFPGTREVIESLALLDAFGKLHTTVRSVVLAAAAGNGLDIELLPIGAF
ncbi:hypothetical protein ACT17_22775 [Mycolicibacterium conceptionense]|uniref:Uncharacterized protein n=1 Tax=Mycolicibacterium conceptionense TaxID=451644 RepID=A0A0J8WSE0_9MYCO|nr:hypothetical protein ACT17_22775 [Mycolicibacterium conceptionense]